MEKITKTYVEKIYRGLLFSESSIKEVAERNPMQVENDGKMQGFRFYDKEYVVDGEKLMMVKNQIILNGFILEKDIV